LHEISEAERYIPINFVKDLRRHIAAKRRGIFGGAPGPDRQICKSSHPTQSSKQQRCDHASKQTPNKQKRAASSDLIIGDDRVVILIVE
jgi:hypothetical protein